MGDSDPLRIRQGKLGKDKQRLHPVRPVPCDYGEVMILPPVTRTPPGGNSSGGVFFYWEPNTPQRGSQGREADRLEAPVGEAVWDTAARPCELFCERSEAKEPQGVQLL